MISKAPRHDDLITHYPMRACWAGRTAPRPMPKRRKSSAVTPGQRKLTGIGSLGVSAGHGSRFGECPICEGSFPLHALRSHADGCVGEPSPEPSTSAPTSLRGPSGNHHNALTKLKSTSGPVARVRIGGPDAAWRPCTVESLKDVVPDLPFALVERVMPPRDADALLEDLRAEATTWGQDEWWIAGEARKAPRLTAVYEMRVDDARAEALRMAGLDDDEEEEEEEVLVILLVLARVQVFVLVLVLVLILVLILIRILTSALNRTLHAVFKRSARPAKREGGHQDRN